LRACKPGLSKTMRADRFHLWRSRWLEKNCYVWIGPMTRKMRVDSVQKLATCESIVSNGFRCIFVRY
jgi:hypothetical protein